MFKQPYVRQAELAEALGISHVTIWNWRRSGFLPEPKKLGPRFVCWESKVINAWIEEQGLS